MLDTEASSATLGKTAGKDAEHNKPTYVSVMSVNEARQFADELRREALQALAEFDDKALRLRQIADFIVLRKF